MAFRNAPLIRHDFSGHLQEAIRRHAVPYHPEGSEPLTREQLEDAAERIMHPGGGVLSEALRASERIYVDAERITANRITADTVTRIDGNTNTSPAQARGISWGEMLGSMPENEQREIQFSNGSMIRDLQGTDAQDHTVRRREIREGEINAYFNGENIGIVQSMASFSSEGDTVIRRPFHLTMESDRQAQVYDSWHRPDHHVSIQLHQMQEFMQKGMKHGDLDVFFPGEEEPVNMRIKDGDFKIIGEATYEQRRILLKEIGEENGGLIGDQRFSYILDERYWPYVDGARSIFKWNKMVNVSISRQYLPGKIYCECSLNNFDQGNHDDVDQAIQDMKCWNAFVLYLYSIQRGIDPLAVGELGRNGEKVYSIENKYLYIHPGRSEAHNELIVNTCHKEQGFEVNMIVERVKRKPPRMLVGSNITEVKKVENRLWEIGDVKDRATYAVHMLAACSKLLNRAIHREPRRAYRVIFTGEADRLDDVGMIFTEAPRMSIGAAIRMTTRLRSVALTVTAETKDYPLSKENLQIWDENNLRLQSINSAQYMARQPDPVSLF